MANSGSTSSGRTVQALDATLSSVTRVLSLLQETCCPVAPRTEGVRAAIGAYAVRDVHAPRPVPAQDIALFDGCAAASSDLIGASPMSPAFLTNEPALVAVGDPLPAGCDCVIDDSLVSGEGGFFEALGGAAPGEGVRRAGDDVKAGEIILAAGNRVSPVSILALVAAQINEIEIRRPRLRIIAAGQGETTDLIACMAKEEGAQVEVVELEKGDAHGVASALSDDGFNAAFIVGGTGTGQADQSVAALRYCGEVVAHGFALDPGRTGAAGVVDGKAVICLPGRFDAGLGVYLAIGRPLLRRLSGAPAPAAATTGPLTRKIASAVGVAQLGLLESGEKGWTPLCVGEATIAHLLRADAYMIVTEGSEGMAEGASIRPMWMPGRRF
jgi:molybdopterin molybdotransferase